MRSDDSVSWSHTILVARTVRVGNPIRNIEMSETAPSIKRAYKRVRVITVREGDINYPSNNLLDLIHWLQEQADEIPYTERLAANCDITVVEMQDGGWPEVSISYSRPETDGELELRALNEQTRKLAHEKRERELLSVLQAKYSQ